MKVPLSLANLKDLDYGKLNVAFQQHLARAVCDCLDRCGDTRPRQISMTFSLEPVTDAEGSCDEVSLECQVSSKVPSHRSKTFACRPNTKGHLTFDVDCHDDVDQGTLSDLEEKDS